MTDDAAPEEREVKLAVDADFALPALDGLTGVVLEELGERELRAVYWDSDDLALARAGVGLRHRNGTWTYKGRTRHEGNSVVREEREVDAPGTGIPAELCAAAGRWVDVATLRSVVTVVTRRRTVLVHRRAACVEVVHDRVSVHSGDRVVDRFTGVEVEYRPSAAGLADDVVALLLEHGAVVDGTAKYVRALRALGHDVAEVSDR